MDKLSHYREVIKKLLTSYQNLLPPSPDEDIERLLAFDQERDHYLWFRYGWHEKKRARYITVYIRLKNEKILVEEDMTDLGVVDDLFRS